MKDNSRVRKELPSGYGDNKIVLMTRDPHTLFSYWEVQQGVLKNAEESAKAGGNTSFKKVLRIYDATGNADTPRSVMDLEIVEGASSWYINGVASGKEWLIDIGLLCPSGDFFALARSNVTITPSNSMSEICDEEWMCPKELYSKMFIAAGGKEIEKGSFGFPSSGSISLRTRNASGSFILGE
ncbi:MAG: DUF4912 domain-containing protein [Candidatus Omnitrophota bacterium]